MLSGKLLICVILVAVSRPHGHSYTSKSTSASQETTAEKKRRKKLNTWREALSASLPFPRLPRLEDDNELDDAEIARALPPELVRERVRELVPPPLCAGRCAAPPRGPVCAFDASGTARTFATLCELEAVSCRESTYYAITSLGEC